MMIQRQNFYTKADVNVRKEEGKNSRIIKIVYLIIRLFCLAT